MQPTQQTFVGPALPANTDDLVLRDFTAALWRSKWWIGAATALCVVAAIAASFVWPKEYEAKILLSPVTSQSNSSSLGGLSSAVSQLGSIASLGLLGGVGGGAKAEALATLESEALTERFIRENDLLPVLYHSRWDSQQKRWKDSDPRNVPTLWKANVFFGRTVRYVKETAKTGLVTLTITWTDPAAAARWANGLVKMTNDYLQEKAIKESDRSIAYLNQQLTNTSVVELRNSIYSLMESEIKKQMLARGSEEYALKVIDPAVPPEKASSPQRLLWAGAGLCLGLLMSAAFIFARVVLHIEPGRLDASSA